MPIQFNPPLIQTAELSLNDARIALPEDPAQLLSMTMFTSPLPLQVALLHADIAALAAASVVALRFTVHSAPNGAKSICVSTMRGATQLRVLLRASSPATLTWLNSCHDSEQITVRAQDIETGEELVFSSPLHIPDIIALMGLLREPRTLSEQHGQQGMAWLASRLSSPLELMQATDTPVRKVLMCVEQVGALIPLMPGLGMQSSLGASLLQ